MKTIRHNLLEVFCALLVIAGALKTIWWWNERTPAAAIVPGLPATEQPTPHRAENLKLLDHEQPFLVVRIGADGKPSVRREERWPHGFVQRWEVLYNDVVIVVNEAEALICEDF